jgi:putative ABC transport system substrate-binding protein
MTTRREIITHLGGAAIALTGRIPKSSAETRTGPVIGMLLSGLRGRTQHFVSAFHRGLAEAGFIDGNNVSIAYSFAEGQFDQLPRLADEIVKRKVDVIVAGPRADRFARAATKSIPIVFMTGADPVRTGAVVSINRPGGNVTGATLLSADLEAKRIGLLYELVPRSQSLAILYSSDEPESAVVVQQSLDAAASLGLKAEIVSATTNKEVDAAFVTFKQQTEALVVTTSLFFLQRRELLIDLSTRFRIPTIYGAREFAEAGGLISYSADAIEGWRQVGVSTGRILKGAKPGDLPVMLPTKYELIINLKSAKLIEIKVPPMLLARADEVIE